MSFLEANFKYKAAANLQKETIRAKEDTKLFAAALQGLSLQSLQDI